MGNKADTTDWLLFSEIKMRSKREEKGGYRR